MRGLLREAVLKLPESAASSIRFGPGSTSEVGMDFANMKVKKVAVITDKTIVQLRPMETATQALELSGIKYEIFDDVMVEPKDYSVKKAIEFGKRFGADAYLAVGGGWCTAMTRCNVA